MSHANPVSAFRKIDTAKVTATANQLALRVNERFPESGLGKVATEVAKISQEAVARTEDFNRPTHWLRIPAFVLILLILTLLFWMIPHPESPPCTRSPIPATCGIKRKGAVAAKQPPLSRSVACRDQCVSFLYLIRCGLTESGPSLRFLSSS